MEIDDNNLDATDSVIDTEITNDLSLDSAKILDSSISISPEPDGCDRVLSDETLVEAGSGSSPSDTLLKSSVDEINPRISSPILLLEAPPPQPLIGDSEEVVKAGRLRYGDGDYDCDYGSGGFSPARYMFSPRANYMDRSMFHPERGYYMDHHGFPRRNHSPYGYYPSKRYSICDRDFYSYPSSNSPPPVQEPLPPPPTRDEVEATGVGAGLKNMGNTCFINAILQCFLHTVPLIQGLTSQDHTLPCARAGEGFCVICALRDQSILSFTNSGWRTSPTKIVKNLKYFSSFFQEYQQEDAHEFLQCFLDKLETCWSDFKREDESLGSQDVNLVQQVFGGRLVSKLECCSCGHCSDTYEPLIDLSLEIDDVDTLPCALESFTKLEKLDDPDTKLTCENCKEKVLAEKQLLLDQAPAIATFHLKRFKTDGYSVTKIGKHIDFPLELDLQPYTSESQNMNELKYSLYGVLVHRGAYSTSGHYFCYIRSSPDVWHRLDDEEVERVDQDSVLSQCAYILFYAKHGTPWFSSVCEVKKPCPDNDLSNSSPKSVLDNQENDSAFNDSALNSESSSADKSKMDDEELKCNEVADAPKSVLDNQENEPAFIDSVWNSESSTPEIFEMDDEELKCNDINVSMQNIRMTDDDIKPTEENSRCDESLYSEKKSTVFTTENRHNEDTSKAAKSFVFNSLTPSGSPTQEAGLSSSKGGSFSIPRDHLKTQNQVASRKSPRQNAKNSEKMEAVRYLNKNMRGSRGMKFLSAMKLSPNKMFSPTKKRKLKSSPCKKGSPNARRRLDHSSVRRNLAVFR